MNQVQNIPLEQLRISPLNVRKTKSSSDAELVASIEALGLLQNLTVVSAQSAGDHPVDDVYHVIAGGRRLHALNTLAAAGKIEKRMPVPCLIVSGMNDEEISLAENVVREAMHPADQFEAYKALISSGLTESEVASRFGVMPLFVRQRLKLANVSPKIIKLYREDKLDLDAVEAFALSDDHAEQERILKAGCTHDYQIRDQLTKNEISIRNRRARFVGLEAYEAAGGVVRRDLFGDENDAYIVDNQLLNKLIDEKMTAKVDKIRAEGWAFVEFGFELQTWQYTELPGKRADMDKTKTGALVTVNHAGQFDIIRGVLKPGQKLKADGSVKGSPEADKPKKKTNELSFAQVQQLQAERTAVASLHLAEHVDVGLAALAAALAHTVFGIRSDVDTVVRIAQTTGYNGGAPHTTRETIAQHPATKKLKELEAKIFATLPKSGSVFAWLLTQPMTTTYQLLAFCAGDSVVAIDHVLRKNDAGAEFCTLAGVRMANHWKLSEEWLAKQSIAYIVAAVKEHAGKAAAESVAKCKGKAAAAKLAVDLMNVDTLRETPWIPAPLRAVEPKSPKAKGKA